MSTQCSTTELYAHAAPASSWGWYIIQAYFSWSQLSFGKQPLDLQNQILEMEGFGQNLGIWY